MFHKGWIFLYVRSPETETELKRPELNVMTHISIPFHVATKKCKIPYCKLQLLQDFIRVISLISAQKVDNGLKTEHISVTDKFLYVKLGNIRQKNNK